MRLLIDIVYIHAGEFCCVWVHGVRFAITFVNPCMALCELKATCSISIYLAIIMRPTAVNFP